MPKLSDTQLVLLSKAAQREDRAVEPPPRPGARSAAMIDALIQRGLLAEVAAERTMPVYRHDETDQEPKALVITELGLVAIGVTADLELEASEREIKGAKGNRRAASSKPKTKKAVAPPSPAGGKTALVIKLLQRKEGASIEALTEATGWLPHSARAALTGLRKKGHAIVRDKGKNNTTVYRLKKAA